MGDAIRFAPGSAPPPDLGVSWNDGTNPDEPPAHVHHLDEHTVLIRQSLRSSPEGPFLVLFFGNEQALLWDTGHGRDPEVWPLRRMVDELIDTWLAKNHRADYHLVVAHSHAHRDHISGDVQFADRPHTTVVGVDIDSIKEFFDLPGWPGGAASVDLGGRELTLIPSPGHHETAISLLDSYTGILLAGDTVYPGRLYVPDMPAFLLTMDRLTELAESGAVSWVLGCHIEIDRDGREYRLGTRQHPREESPFMPLDRLGAVRDAAREIADTPGVHPYEGFVIYNGNRIRDQVRLMARGLLARLSRA